tara:strand:+ start:171 stop:701 length:531 start_codon:yes stop_codon:yes gene_type:complete
MNWNNDLYKILEFQHVKPGKGPAFVRTKMQSLISGKIIDNTFNAGVKIDPVRIETRQYQYLFNDDSGFHFMNTDDYEQTFLQKEMINAPQFLKEGDMVDITYHAEEEKPLSCDLPAFVNLEITFTEPGIKGDTATNATKPATVETGAEVRVPLFINEGDRIRIDTRDGSYCERLKS